MRIVLTLLIGFALLTLLTASAGSAVLTFDRQAWMHDMKEIRDDLDTDGDGLISNQEQRDYIIREMERANNSTTLIGGAPVATTYVFTPSDLYYQISQIGFFAAVITGVLGCVHVAQHKDEALEIVKGVFHREDIEEE